MHATLTSKSAAYRKMALVSASSVLALAAASPALAQAEPGNAAPDTAMSAAAAAQPQPDVPPDQQAAPDQANAAQPIIITGIRGSLQRNLNAKRNAPGVMEVISAEDIGKFPDPNVADALQRVPGVSIQRVGARGEANGITVRGFGGDFNDTLFDGRHISTVNVDRLGNPSRAVDFTTVGADFIGQINVLKTPDVELSTSAIGATINVLLPKPFDYSGFRVAAFAGGSLQSRDKHVRPRAGLLISDTFANGTLGILADATYTREDTKANHVFIPGWIGNHFAPCQAGPINLTCVPTSDPTSQAGQDPNNLKTVLGWFPQQNGAEQVTTADERIDGRIALQWRPSDDLLLTIDDNFSRQKVTSNSYGYAAWFNGDDLRNVKYDSNGSVIDFNQFGTPMDFNANRTKAVNQRNQVGANLKWSATEHLKFDADASLDRAVFNPGHNGFSDSMDIGYGGYNTVSGNPFDPACATAQFASSGGCVTTVLGAPTGVQITGPSSSDLPNIHDVGPANNASQFLDTSQMGSHVIVRFRNYNTDLVKQAKLLGRWEADNFKLTFGGQYADDKFHTENANTFANGVFASFAGYGTPSGRTGGLYPLPPDAFDGTVSTSGFIPGYGNNALAPGFVIYSPYDIYNALEAAGHNTEPGFDPGSVLDVEEKTLSLFMKANFVTDIAGMPFHFNAGLREESTRLKVSAIGRSITALTVDPGDPTLITPTFSDPQAINGKSKYSFLLPSFDVKLDVTPQLILRLDASRTLTRPQLINLRPTINFGSLRRGSLSGSGGNPDLKPYLSDNFDVGAEWYYAPNSYFAIDGFYKHITNFIVGGVRQESFPGIIDPFTGQPAVFNVTGQVNGPDANVRGVEIALQHVFGNTGFGFQANATLIGTNRKFPTEDVSGNGFAITGLANSANFVGFYDKHGFQVRVAVNWRGSYLLGLGQNQGGTFGAEPVYVDKQLQVDASASYDITRQFTVFGEVTNINNSNYSTHGRFSDQPLDAWNYGRRYTAGVRFHLSAAPPPPPPPPAALPPPPPPAAPATQTCPDGSVILATDSCPAPPPPPPPPPPAERGERG
ncbi:MAG: TonB-dependent receptor [Rhizomicrobium sp.]|jgi:iron complex outermembrane receptor protein